MGLGVLLSIPGLLQSPSTQTSKLEGKPKSAALSMPQMRLPAQSESLSQSPNPASQGPQPGVEQKAVWPGLSEQLEESSTQTSKLEGKPKSAPLSVPQMRLPAQSESLSQSPPPPNITGSTARCGTEGGVARAE